MDFFEQQDIARRQSGRLVFYFILAVVAIVLAIYFVALIALGMAGGEENAFAQSPFQPELFLAVAGGTLCVILLGSLYKTAQLSAGGETVALMMGGRLISQQTSDMAERRLLNVVEEMALASGAPVPPVYVMDNEPSINAFAAGFEPGDAVIGVSHGCLEYLNRDELQGVMAHEFSHLLNGDMRLNLRLVGILHGILVIALIGWFVIRSVGYSSHRSRSSKDSGGAVMAIMGIGLGLLVIGGVGLLFGKLIKSAVSRQREYLADASAVQFTRLPEGIAGALKKIGGRPETSKIEDPHAEEISHMFFGSAFGSLRSHLFSTHPPLVPRIQRIDPNFDGKFPKKVKPVRVTPESLKPKPEKKPADPFGAMRAGGLGEGIPLDPSGVLGQIGAPGMEQLLYAAMILETIPTPVRDSAHEPYGARAVIYAILLDRDAEIRGRQMDALKDHAEELSFRETQRLIPLLDELPEQARLPLLETTFPALKQLSADQYAKFHENVERLIQADDKLDLLEYSVQSMLWKNLDVHFGRAKPSSVRHRRLEPILPSLVDVLSTLAYAGHDSPEEVQRAFDLGMQETGHTGTLLPKSDCSLRKLDAALKTLSEAAPQVKKQALAACVGCVAADGQVTPRESQLVQTTAAMLGVPVPPIRG